MSEIKKITVTDFEEVLGEKISEYLKQKIDEYDFAYYEFSKEEEEEIIQKIEQHLGKEDFVKAGKHRRDQWEKGWEENLKNLDEAILLDKNGFPKTFRPSWAKFSPQEIIPKYFAKHDILRWKQKFVKPLKKNFELNSLYVIQDWLFDKYIRNVETIYEFGCGTGHNLLHAREINQDAEMWGLDWTKSSQEIIKKLSQKNSKYRFNSKNFDYFNPDYDFKLKDDSVVFTVVSLEQVGNDFKKFIDYLLKQNVGLCIHIEPIIEHLDEKNKIDNLSIEYIKKRNYLNGYLEHLRNLESKGELKILKAQRSYIGSMFIDGYSVIVWSKN
ncbi:class I SAM-dependent methyltransferase [Candidatus Nitrosopelagicus sp.]|nr:class I SAM-dependent methyltransferase [Candidatus Nitrosopelagicus sp.]